MWDGADNTQCMQFNLDSEGQTTLTRTTISINQYAQEAGTVKVYYVAQANVSSQSQSKIVEKADSAKFSATITQDMFITDPCDEYEKL